MTPPSNNPHHQDPANIAREAFRILAQRRIAPTPDAYRKIYDEIAGVKPQASAESVLRNFADSLGKAPREIASIGQLCKRAAQAGDWEAYGRALAVLAFSQPARLPASAAAPVSTPIAEKRLEKLLETMPQAPVLRDILSRILALAVVSLLHSEPELAAEAETLGQLTKQAKTHGELEEISSRVKQLCFKIEMHSADMGEQQELLLRLFNLLLDNIGELLEDDSWLRGQIDNVQNLLAGPANQVALQDAAKSLKEIIHKQGVLKHSLAEAKMTVKTMMITFIDRLSTVASSTGNYHEKMAAYSEQINKTTDIITLNRILGEVMRDTRAAQLEALRSRDNMAAARQQLEEAENRVNALQSQLEEMSERVREDQLTGSLNRRGLEDVFDREAARSDRRQSPLCIALLDLDDFKKINDTYGHQAGDEVLIHLVRVVKETLRVMDVIARFGGEEFVILLPDTPLAEAVQTISRLQRELTKRIFLHRHEKLLITFSAGVALRKEGEDQAALIKRADDALYQAKRTGKNRVVAAE